MLQWGPEGFFFFHLTNPEVLPGQPIYCTHMEDPALGPKDWIHAIPEWSGDKAGLAFNQEFLSLVHEFRIEPNFWSAGTYHFQGGCSRITADAFGTYRAWLENKDDYELLCQSKCLSVQVTFRESSPIFCMLRLESIPRTPLFLPLQRIQVAIDELRAGQMDVPSRAPRKKFLPRTIFQTPEGQTVSVEHLCLADRLADQAGRVMKVVNLKLFEEQAVSIIRLQIGGLYQVMQGEKLLSPEGAIRVQHMMVGSEVIVSKDSEEKTARITDLTAIEGRMSIYEVAVLGIHPPQPFGIGSVREGHREVLRAASASV
ncbi:unnamed protein product [Durusdinium trenchii]|uniref:Uncharacterized protein n=1 Tax=Durusdinium trenchii TaxID=1381693 RepID=A0ABP0LB42_9DINO